jgi:hypothetical protein
MCTRTGYSVGGNIRSKSLQALSYAYSGIYITLRSLVSTHDGYRSLGAFNALWGVFLEDSDSRRTYWLMHEPPTHTHNTINNQ